MSMKNILISRGIVAVAGLSVCGITGYLVYLLFKKDEEEEDHDSHSTYATLEVEVPKEFVRILIGQNGKNIKSIQAETETKISFKEEEPNSKHRTCIIRGKRENCQQVQTIVNEFIRKQPVLKNDEMWISQKLVGKIIGRCGEKILEISAKSGAKVHFDSHRSASPRKLMFKGTDEQIHVAKKLVNEIIKKCQVSHSQMEVSLAKREPRAQAKSPVPLLEVGSPKVERISPVPRQSDTQFEVYVSAMIDPSHFWLQMVGPKATQLDQLVEDMTEYYGKGENQNLHTLNSLENGDLVAAQFNFDKKWYRAEVLKVKNGNGMDPLAELYFVDYGDADLVPCKNVFELRTDFLRLNFQAIECYLAGIEPKGGTWSTEALDKFEEWAHVAQWKKLSAKIDGYCVREKIRAKREGSSVPGIHLYDVNNERDIDIAEELVAHEYAVFKVETDTVASTNDIVCS